MAFDLDPDQYRIFKWRTTEEGLGTVIGPPGSGKTTTGSMIAVSLVAEGRANRMLLAAYTNAAADQFCWELNQILGTPAANNLCIRTGNYSAVNNQLPIKFSTDIKTIREKKIVVCTILSLKHIENTLNFDHIIIDEAGITRPEHLLIPLELGLNSMALSEHPTINSNNIDDPLDLLREFQLPATIIGDPKQSKPISPMQYDRSAIDWARRKTKTDILKTTHRLPDTLAELVDKFAGYEGLRSSPDVASRRLSLKVSPNYDLKEIIKPETVTTFVDINGPEREAGASSWENDTEAKACVKICKELNRINPSLSIAIVTRYTEQQAKISSYIQRMGYQNVRVVTTSAALGTEADVVLFSLTRNNSDQIIGAAGGLEDLNVGISRSKYKLIMLGNFDMLLNGWTYIPTTNRYGRKSPGRTLGKLIEQKYGEIIQAPQTLLS